MKLNSKVFFTAATACLGFASVTFVVERYSGAPNMPIGTLLCLTFGLGSLCVFNLLEKQKDLLGLNSIIFGSYIVGGFIL